MRSASQTLDELARLLHEGATIAKKLRRPRDFELKPDGSIVTPADKTIETFLRPELLRMVEGSGIWGEEFGLTSIGENGTWLIDPIDGTSNYAFGSPLWAISVGFVAGDRFELGAVYLPDLDELYLGYSEGATLNGMDLAPIRPGPVRPHELVGYNDTAAQAIPGIPGKMRLAGAVVVDGAFMAAGRYRGIVGVREKLYDVAGVLAILSGLGADIRHANGDPFLASEHLKEERIGKPWIAFPRESGFQTA